MNIYQFVAVLVWQFIVIVFLYVFRSELAALLSRIRSAEIFGQKILADNVKNFQPSSGSGVDIHVSPILQGQALSVPSDFKPVNNPVAIYFFSHDLMLTYAALLTGSRKATVELTMRSASAHFATLGFGQTDLNERFSKVYKEIVETDRKDWTNEFRGDLANDIWAISRFVGAVIEIRIR